MFENEDFLSAMYDMGEDEPEAGLPPIAAEPEPKGIPGRILSMPGMSNLLRALQAELAGQKATISKLEAHIRRLESQLRSTQHVVRSSRNRLSDLDQEVGNKLDRREF